MIYSPFLFENERQKYVQFFPFVLLSITPHRAKHKFSKRENMFTLLASSRANPTKPAVSGVRVFAYEINSDEKRRRYVIGCRVDKINHTPTSTEVDNH